MLFQKDIKKLSLQWSLMDSAIHAMVESPDQMTSSSTPSFVLITSLLSCAGIMHPSLISFVYFFLFCSIMTLWSRLHTFSDTAILRLLLAVQVYTATHLVVLYLYQFQFLQNMLPPDSLAARYCATSQSY